MNNIIQDLINVNREVLAQMSGLLDEIPAERYSFSNGTDGSIGQHTRHIIEFYECFTEGLDTDVVNYDSRRRNPLVEADPTVARNEIDLAISSLDLLKADRSLTIKADGFDGDASVMQVPSLVSREVLYLLEHTVHHMAIIRMLVRQVCPELRLPKEFGVAYSTLRYREESAN